jgi:hypothetical protein
MKLEVLNRSIDYVARLGRQRGQQPVCEIYFLLSETGDASGFTD